MSSPDIAKYPGIGGQSHPWLRSTELKEGGKGSEGKRKEELLSLHYVMFLGNWCSLKTQHKHSIFYEALTVLGKTDYFLCPVQTMTTFHCS